MQEIFDTKGQLLGSVPVSELKLQKLAAGETLTLLFRTPNALHETLGPRAVHFDVSMVGLCLVTPEPEKVREAIKLLQEIGRQ